MYGSSILSSLGAGGLLDLFLFLHLLKINLCKAGNLGILLLNAQQDMGNALHWPVRAIQPIIQFPVGILLPNQVIIHTGTTI